MYSQLLMINMRSNDWISLVFVLIFVLLAFIKVVFQKRFELLILFSRKYWSFYSKESPLIASVFNLLFFPVNLLVTGLVIFYFAKEYFPDLFDSYDAEFFAKILLSIVLFYAVKIVLRFIVNIVLLTTKAVRQFSFYKLSLRNFSSIVLIPFLLIHQYSALQSSISIIFLLSAFIVFLAVRYIYSLRLIFEQKQYPFLYIILYLCTLEFIPALLYIKAVFILVNNNFEGF